MSVNTGELTASGKVVESNEGAKVLRRQTALTIPGEQRVATSVATVAGLENTARTRSAYLLGKPSAGSAEVYHLDSDQSGWVVHENGKGQRISSEPTVSWTIAQGYRSDASGELLLDTCCEKPVLGAMVEWTHLPVSGVQIEGKTDHRLMAVVAPDSTAALALVSQGGKMTFKRLPLPLGSFIAQESSTAPDGYLACDGGRIEDRLTYLDLVELRGTTLLPNIPDEEKGDITLKWFIRAV